MDRPEGSSPALCANCDTELTGRSCAGCGPKGLLLYTVFNVINIGSGTLIGF